LEITTRVLIWSARCLPDAVKRNVDDCSDLAHRASPLPGSTHVSERFGAGVAPFFKLIRIAFKQIDISLLLS
jgi:hypothetical protein